jgi:hypothetical protein
VESAVPPHFIADGCGQRVVYECPRKPVATSGSFDFASQCRMVLVNRLDLAAPVYAGPETKL